MGKLPASAVIIGAGIGGLATANLLAKAGVAVTIVEKGPRPGGRAGILKKDGFTFDTGPSWYLMPEVFEHYYSLLGEDIRDHLDLVRLDPAYELFYETGGTMTVRADRGADAQTFAAIEPGADRALGNYLESAGHTYGMATRHFLYNNFQPGRWMLSPAILRSLPRMTRLAATPIHRYVKSFVSDPRLQQALEYPMVFLGTSPYAAPAIYSLMSHMDFSQGVYYPRGGMYGIIESLVGIGRKLGVEYMFDSPVESIVVAGRTAMGVALAGGRTITADIVISNADLHHTETVLLPPKARSYPESYWQKREAGPSAILMYLGVKGALPQLSHHNLVFTADWRRNFDDIFKRKQWPRPASMYVCKPSATDPTVAPKGHENVFVLVPGPAAPLAAGEIDTLTDAYLAQLSRAVGVPDLADRLVVRELYGPDDFSHDFNAWQGTALGLSHRLRQSAVFRPANRSRKVSNLYYAGANTVPGIGLPMCLISAELIYKRLTGDRSAGPLRDIDAPLPAAPTTGTRR